VPTADDVTSYLAANIHSRAEVLARPCPVPLEPGVYGWWFRELPVLPGTENDDDAVTLDEDEDGGIGRHLDGVIAAVRASSAR
jgi:hypothetical protein